MFAALIASFFVSMLTIPLLMRIALPLRLTDIPGGRKVHAEPIPRVGGIGIAIGAFLPVLLWLPMTSTVLPFVIGCMILVAIGILDDRFDLDFRLKLMAQIAAAALAVWGGISFVRLPFFPDPVPNYLGYPLTILFLVAVTNAVNFLDGLDGLAAGHSVMTLSAIAFLGYLSGESIVSFIAIALIGSLFGFLRYNTYPARVFMGDAGSQLLGFGAAALALLLTNNRPGDFNAAFPIALVGLPLLDVLFVLFTRLRRGLSPFAADRNHIHHRLLGRGLGHREAVSIIYVLQAIFVFGAVALRGASGEVLASGYLVLGGALIVTIALAEARGWTVRAASEPASAARRDAATAQKALPLLLLAMEIMTASFLIIGSLLATHISRDVSLMAAALAGGIALALLATRRSRDGLFRLSAYLACLLVAYFLDPRMDAHDYLRTGVYGFLIALAFVVFAAVRLSGPKTFRATPQDLLILCLIVFFMVLPSDIGFPSSSATDWHLGSLFFRVAVLFYAAELLLSQPDRPAPILNAAALFSFASLAVRGWPLG